MLNVKLTSKLINREINHVASKTPLPEKSTKPKSRLELKLSLFIVEYEYLGISNGLLYHYLNDRIAGVIQR